MKSKCCNANRHNLFSDCCSDCKEWAEFFDEEDEEPLSPPTDPEIEEDLAWCERERFKRKVEPGFDALNKFLYNSIRLQHEAAIAGDIDLMNLHIARAGAIRESIETLAKALDLHLQSFDLTMVA